MQRDRKRQERGETRRMGQDKRSKRAKVKERIKVKRKREKEKAWRGRLKQGEGSLGGMKKGNDKGEGKKRRENLFFPHWFGAWGPFLPGGGTDEGGMGMCCPEDPLFTPPLPLASPISSKRVSSQDSF